jgi:hypothetical protein
MKFIITEEQYKQILNEGITDTITKKIEKFKEFFQKIIDDLKTSYNFHIKFGLTYGAGIGAIIQPITDYLNSRYPNLETSQIEMLAVASIMIVFFEGKEIEKIEKKVTEESLENELADGVGYAEVLSVKFKKVINVLGMSVYRLSDIVAYAFLLPLLSEIYKFMDKGAEAMDFDLISKSIMISTGIVIGGNLIKRMVEKLNK